MIKLAQVMEWETISYLHSKILECKKSWNPFTRRNLSVYETAFINLLLGKVDANAKSDDLRGPYITVLTSYLQGEHHKVKKNIQKRIEYWDKPE